MDNGLLDLGKANMSPRRSLKQSLPKFTRNLTLQPHLSLYLKQTRLNLQRLHQQQSPRPRPRTQSQPFRLLLLFLSSLVFIALPAARLRKAPVLLQKPPSLLLLPVEMLILSRQLLQLKRRSQLHQLVLLQSHGPSFSAPKLLLKKQVPRPRLRLHLNRQLCLCRKIKHLVMF